MRNGTHVHNEARTYRAEFTMINPFARGGR